MPVSQNTLKLRRWWNSHHRSGGSVYLIKTDWCNVTHPEKYTTNLYNKFRSIPFENILKFSESEITDNSMPDREVMEDASKIHMLRNKIKNKSLHFLPQLIHEPWYSRYRVHPGSGRAAAMWLEGIKSLSAIYIHFDEEEFKIPKGDFTQITKISDFEESIIFQKPTLPEYEIYEAFPTLRQQCALTQNMDFEWHWHYLKNKKSWKFLRYSEGKNFLRHKYEWRSFAIDLWNNLN